MTFKIATTARKLKVTMVIDAAPFAALRAVPDDAPARTEITIAVGGRTVSADLATKSIRKAVKTLIDHGTDNVVVILQGALSSDNCVEEAGITAQVKVPSEVSVSVQPSVA
jgi:hypothetical protein